MTWFELEPVHYARVPKGDWLTGLPKLLPYEHQRQLGQLARESLESGGFTVLVNCATTGGGKTYAAYAHPADADLRALGVYPTNELLHDQLRAVRELLSSLGKAERLQPLAVDSESLDYMAAELAAYSAGPAKGHASMLDAILSWRHWILTNPDILSLVMQGKYGPHRIRGLAERLRVGFLRYPIWVFDEFHLYNAKQVGDVLCMASQAIALVKTGVLPRDQGWVWIFNSATPSSLFLDALRRLDVRVHLVQAEVVQPTAGDAHCVTYPVQLGLAPYNEGEWEGLAAVQSALPWLDEFLDHHAGARVLVVLDSVRQAIELADLLRARHGSGPVGEVHGLATREERDEAIKCQFTVGTAAIEVGVDLVGERHKDVLVFEARSAASFLQRLGRLARHPKTGPIPNVALAFLPTRVIQSLTNSLGLRPGGTPRLTRTALAAAVEQAFGAKADFADFLTRYTPLHASALLPTVAGLGTDEADRQCLRRSFTAALSTALGVTLPEEISTNERALVDAMVAFRGGGFPAAVLDVRSPAEPAIRTYDMLWVLRHGDLEELSREDFLDAAERAALALAPHDRDGLLRKASQLLPQGSDVSDVLGVCTYVRLSGLLSYPRRLHFSIPRSWARKSRELAAAPAPFTGLAVHRELPAPRFHDWLREKRLVGRLVRGHPDYVARWYRLPPLFSLIPLSSHGLRAEWALALGQEALLLDVAVRAASQG